MNELEIILVMFCICIVVCNIVLLNKVNTIEKEAIEYKNTVKQCFELETLTKRIVELMAQRDDDLK